MSLVYHPSQKTYSNPKRDFDYNFSEIEIKSGGSTLKSWYIKSGEDDAKKILFAQFHGNAQNMTSHYRNMIWAVDNGQDLITFDFSGYGGSTGAPSPRKVVEDSKQFLQYVIALYKRSNYKKLVLVGQSLGGNILLKTLQETNHLNIIDLIVIDSSFLSYEDIAFDKLKSSPLTFLFSPLAYVLMDDEMSPKFKLSKMKYNFLIVHGIEDNIVPFKYGQEIYNNISSLKFFLKHDIKGHISAFNEIKHQEYLMSLIDSIKNIPNTTDYMILRPRNPD